jgi:transposase InsO family protein
MEWCRETLSETIRTEGQPEIFKTDKGSQFTSTNFINPLLDRDIKISMRTPRGTEKEEHLTMFFGVGDRTFLKVTRRGIRIPKSSKWWYGFVSWNKAYVEFYNHQRKHQ